MTAVSAAGAQAPGQASKPAAPAVLAPPLRPKIDFRSLLRDDPLSKPEAALRPAAGPLGAPTARALPGTPAPSAGRGPLPDAMTTEPEGRARLGLLRDGDALDPVARHHASLAPPDALFGGPAAAIGPAPQALLAPAPAEAVATRASASLEELLPALVRKVAWSGDGKRGTMRMELGAGELAGSTLLVHADGGRVRVHLEVPPGIDASGWQQRLEERLRARGVQADAVEIT